MKEHGFYIIKDEYFELVKDPYLKFNKGENRPVYYCFKEDANESLFWMIPLSSKVSKYKDIIFKRQLSNKPFDGIYICKLPTSREAAFLIQDIFPVTSEFIAREFLIGDNHLILTDEKDIQAISKKAQKVIKLISRNIKITKTSPDIVKIISVLTNKLM